MLHIFILAMAVAALIAVVGTKPFWSLFCRWILRHRQAGYSRRAVEPAIADEPHQRGKPEWVLREVLRLKALLGKNQGCHKVVDTFNRLHAPMTVSKTFVAEAVKTHQYLLMTITSEIRAKKPWPVPVNSTWGMDMKFVTDASGTKHACVGILDHGSRVCTRLAVLLNKRSWTLLGHLCLAIGKYGKPGAVRTDNEATMNSFVFRTFLKLVGIRKQTVPVAAPWCNGKIERYFGTIKPMLRQLVIPGKLALQQALDHASIFYNHVRTHQNLDGLTPAEAWEGMTATDVQQLPVKSADMVQALGGVWDGYHLRR